VQTSILASRGRAALWATSRPAPALQNEALLSRRETAPLLAAHTRLRRGAGQLQIAKREQSAGAAICK